MRVNYYNWFVDAEFELLDGGDGEDKQIYGYWINCILSTIYISFAEKSTYEFNKSLKSRTTIDFA